jgi:hypothetical protein
MNGQWHQTVGLWEEYFKRGDYDSTRSSGRWPVFPRITESTEMKISAMTQSKYLKQDDAPDDTIVTIQKVGQANIAKEGAPQEFKWMIRFHEFDKPMVLNRTNIALLGKFLGDDTDDWVGKQVVLYNDETIQFEGKITGGLRFKRVKASKPAKPAPPMMEDEDKEQDSDVPF